MKSTSPPKPQAEDRASVNREKEEKKVVQDHNERNDDQIKKTDNLKRTINRSGNNKNDRNFLIL